MDLVELTEYGIKGRVHTTLINPPAHFLEMLHFTFQRISLYSPAAVHLSQFIRISVVSAMLQLHYKRFGMVSIYIMVLHGLWSTLGVIGRMCRCSLIVKTHPK